MELVPIFGNNLFAIKWARNTKDEFSRLFEIWQDAEYLENFFEKHKADLQNDFWGEIFRPLSNYQTETHVLGKSKAKDNWLRIYGLKVDNNIYIITGGAIKLTPRMQDRKHTSNELRNIDSCKKYMIDRGIIDIKKVIEVIES